MVRVGGGVARDEVEGARVERVVLDIHERRRYLEVDRADDVHRAARADGGEVSRVEDEVAVLARQKGVAVRRRDGRAMVIVDRPVGKLGVEACDATVRIATVEGRGSATGIVAAEQPA